MLGFIIALSLGNYPTMSDEWQSQVVEACSNFQDAPAATAIDFQEALLDALN